MKLSNATLHGAILIMEDGDVLDEMTVIDSAIFAINAGTITGCVLVNSAIHVAGGESFGQYEPARATSRLPERQ